MQAIADTDKLVEDGIITRDQARIIEARGRETMVAMAVNLVLFLGIVAATGGLIAWLANAAAVAVLGLVMLGAGVWVLARGGHLYRMFGHAATLIGAGLLIGGLGWELMDKHEPVAGWVLAPFGLAIILGAAWVYGRAGRAGFPDRLVPASILVMGLATHLFGLGLLLAQYELHGWPRTAFFLYSGGLLIGLGWFTDLRLLTALAVVPMAQMLETGSSYFHAVYVFTSPEPTLTILEMAVLIAAALMVARARPERTARHARILALMAYVVANLSALVGSLWGDVVGETLWGPGRFRGDFSGTDPDEAYQAWEQARDAFRATALTIPEAAFAIGWAVVLVAMLAWTAHRGLRGLFNTTLTFAVLHAYTQFFERFTDQPLAWVIGGLMAIPIAWGAWRINLHLSSSAAAH